MDPDLQTIAAVATPAGKGGIGVVRISGPGTSQIAQSMLGRVPEVRKATLAAFRGGDGAVIDQGIALFFEGPESFTGEDVLELQGHGGPVVMDLLLNQILSLGARMARPGEFSERAFLNDKLDLAQAEAIADLIDSASAQAARSAVRSLQGEFSARVHALTESLIGLRMYVEAAIDFPEEEIDFLQEKKIGSRLSELAGELKQLQDKAGQGALLREGLNIVLAGRPNAGKSSLMNSLTGRDTSIVTAIAGTTRDIVDEQVHMDGIPVRLIDTAGLRTAADEIEAEGVRRAQGEIRTADLILVVVDLCASGDLHTQVEELLSETPTQTPRLVVLNKVDLAEAPVQTGDWVTVSALTHQGIDGLKDRIKTAVGYMPGTEGLFSARSRHLVALAQAQEALKQAGRAWRDTGAGELIAEELRFCQQSLGEITGEFSNDDLLGRIFSSFCIGK